jgi:hypothetical protein
MRMPAPQSFAVPAIVLVGLAVVVTALSPLGRVRVAQVRQTIKFDDFYYTVREAVDAVGSAGCVAFARTKRDRRWIPKRSY